MIKQEQRMKKTMMVMVVLMGMWGFIAPASAGDHRIGLGGHYWKTIDDIDISDIDDDGIAMVVSYQYKPTLIGLQLDLEIADEQLTGQDETVYSPQVFLIVGGLVYAGLGVGTHYADGEFADDAFYALKAGLDFELLPRIHLDINANYRFENWDRDEVEGDIDTDTVTLGLVGRIEF
jgi:hypothetical protein